MDFSLISTSQRHTAHRAGRGDGDAERDAAWIATLAGLSGPSYDVANYTDGAPITGNNILAAIRSAYADAIAQTGGGVVQLPPGTFDVGAESLDLYGNGDGKGVWICGSGYTILRWPTGYTGEHIRLRGSPPSPAVWFNGGLANLTIKCVVDDASNTGTGITIDGCVRTIFYNVMVQGLYGGTGWKCREFTLSYNSQYCEFISCHSVANGYNYDFSGLTASTMSSLNSQGAQFRELKLDACQSLSIKGGSIQAQCPVFVEISGNGGSSISFEDLYSEGASPTSTFFQISNPAVAPNYISVKRLYVSNAYLYVFDVATAYSVFPTICQNRVLAEDVHNAEASTYIARSRFSELTFVGMPTPNNPGYSAKFDLDTDTYNRSQFLGRGYFMVGGNDFAVTAINDILAPYAVDIWDFSIASSLSLSGANVNSVTGVVNGNILTPPHGLPQYTASDTAFNNEPSITFARTGVPTTEAYLSCTLSNPLPIGSAPCIMFIYKTDGTAAAEQRIGLALTDTTGTATNVLTHIDDSFTVNTLDGYWQNNGSHSTAPSVSTVHDTTGRLCVVYVDGTNEYRSELVLSEVAHSGDTINSASAAIINTASIGNIPGTATGSQITIPWAAALKTVPPAAVLTRVTGLLRAKYGV